jgi:hypothetical protein
VLNSDHLFSDRLVDIAPHYYDLSNFPQCEAKRVLKMLYKNRKPGIVNKASPYISASGLEFDVLSPAS